MKYKTPTVFLTLALVAALLLSGCQAPKPSSLGNDQVVGVIVNILTSINAGDYAGFQPGFQPRHADRNPRGEVHQLG